MKNITVGIIGFAALILGVYTLVHAISTIFPVAGSENLLLQINKLTLAWLAVYGGFQTLLGKELGRKMVIAWLLFQFLIAGLIALILMLKFTVFAQSDIQPTLSNPYLFIGFSEFCVIALIFLMSVRLADDPSIRDFRHTQIVGKLLSVLSPGFGRVLVGNKIIGLALFSIYFILAAATLSASSSEVQNLVINSVYKLIVWSTFVKFDWSVMQNYEKPVQGAGQLTAQPDSP